eukprot:CAMPEP_0119004400 /NCGR_PEP_ID=MMETSP1176-20130426/1119_1 /TAXON_ID=265551 /ORGANISM="Synedropsis recta cf, Strain CCMP1620" /LENGTH=479 /DNA_ID=CAMNT_0006956097 /DNA_START=326 /DNA_END=1765 /DNA_ORIENTATION=-
MPKKSFRISPHHREQTSKVRQKSSWKSLSFRSIRTTLTHVSTEESYEDETEVVVSSDSCGIEVMNNREAATLNELGQHEYDMQRYEEAIDTWNLALQQQQEGVLLLEEASSSAMTINISDDLRATILWNICKVHLVLNELQADDGHVQNAKQCFDQLRPSLPTLTPPDPSPIMLDYFVQQEEWVGAQRLAILINVEPPIMARIHYECGIQTTTPDSTMTLGDKMDCMTKCLACGGDDGQVMLPKRLKLAAHDELVHLHSAAGSYRQALKHHEARLPLLDKKSDIAKAYFEEAEIQMSLGDQKEAMNSIEKGLTLYPTSRFLLEAKADLLYLTGRIEDSIALHESLLESTTDQLEQTKILYTIGRIYHKTGQATKAISYYHRELELTQQLYGSSHLECTRIYHELARLADEACEYDVALDYLNKALVIEQQQHKPALAKETQKFMGKIHYKTGDFHRALTTSFADLSVHQGTNDSMWDMR